MSKNSKDKWWTKEELEILENYGNKLQLNELMKLLPNRSKSSINKKRWKDFDFEYDNDYISKRKEYALSCRPSDQSYRKLDQNFTLNSLDNTTFQILIASILGDCAVSPNSSGKSFYLRESHCRQQADYVDWKAKKLSIFQPISGDKKDRNQRKFYTPSHEIFTYLRDRFYFSKIDAKVRLIPYDLIARWDYLGFLVWFLDDGNFGDTGVYSISACSYYWEELQVLCNMLNNKFGIELYPYEWLEAKSIKRRKIIFPATSRDKVTPIWLDLFKKFDIPDCMMYKLKEV